MTINPYYNPTGNPVTGSPGASAAIRAEFTAIAGAFELLPPSPLTPGDLVVVNPGGTGLSTTPLAGISVGYATNAGLAATTTALATARAIYGHDFDGTAAVTSIIASTYGGTGSGFTKFTGPASAEKTFTLPDASATILTAGVTATITKGYTFSPNNLGNIISFMIDPTLGNYQYGTNHAATTWTAPSSDCAVTILVTNDSSAGSISFSGFTVGAVTGDALTTTNGDKFLVMIIRINGVATYVVKALQ